MRQRRWLELIKDYDCSINYHAGKANVVADALSRKERLNLLTETKELIQEFEKLEIEVHLPNESIERIYAMTFQPELLERIRKYQDEAMSGDVNQLTGEKICSQPDDKGILRVSSRIWIPNVPELKNEVMKEAHSSRYSIHPGSIKMYQDLHRNFWWPDMKRDIAYWVNKCFTCHKVKAEH